MCDEIAGIKERRCPCCFSQLGACVRTSSESEFQGFDLATQKSSAVPCPSRPQPSISYKGAEHRNVPAAAPPKTAQPSNKHATSCGACPAAPAGLHQGLTLLQPHRRRLLPLPWLPQAAAPLLPERQACPAPTPTAAAADTSRHTPSTSRSHCVLFNREATPGQLCHCTVLCPDQPLTSSPESWL